MRSKILSITILILSIIVIFSSFNSLKSYLLIKNGNKFFNTQEYQNSRDKYNEALKLMDNMEVKHNILKSFYGEKKYDDVITSPAIDGFLKGNSYAFLATSTPEKSKEKYEKALEEYKQAMKISSDVNIKKNYELVLKKLEDENKQQNQNKQEQKKEQQQNNQDNKTNNNNNNNNNNKQQKDKDSEQQNQNKNSTENKTDNKDSKDKQKEKQEQNNKQNEKDRNEQPSENSSNNSEKNQKELEKNGENKVKEDEIKAILKRLEGNEKQAFKNNERVMNIGDDTKHNRW